MLVLQQGEVIRIAEEENRFYLNNILDAICPSLYHKRTNLAQEVKKVVTQYELFQPWFTFVRRSSQVYYFLDSRRAELERMIEDIGQGYFSDQNIETIHSYVDRHYAFVENQFPNSPYSWRQTPIIELLKNDDPDALYCLYVGRIVGFLTDKLDEIVQMKRKQTVESGGVVDSIRQPERREPGIDSETAVGEVFADKQVLNELDDELDEMAEAEDQKAIESHMLGEKQEEGEKDEEKEEDEEEARRQAEFALFLRALQELETKRESPTSDRIPVSDEAIETVRQIVDFLNTRLRILSRWIHIYTTKRVGWSKSLEGLSRNYGELLKGRIELVREQQQKCGEITELLNNNDLPINIYTIGAEQVITYHNSQIGNISRAESQYESLVKATPDDKLYDVHFWAKRYDETIDQLLTFLGRLHREILDPQQSFVFNPIGIELLQGNVYRDFQQLSFGQKSGIILEMVLTTTNRRLVIIDHPEDNLDANSIVNMLAPTLNRLGQDRQIIVATHNSNLVMGLDTESLSVLESRGEKGRIKIQGSPLDREVVREMIEVIEGGIATFETKMKIYEDFITRVRGQIQDIDIMMIESLFRRRTIDRFRNFLQPVISDRSLLDFVRHELKQPSDTRIHNEVSKLRQQLDILKREPWADTLIERLDKLAENLNSHIARLQDAIEDIRLMDTEARPKNVDLFGLLTRLQRDHLLGKGGVRDIQIHIDANLQGHTVYADEDHLRLIFSNLFDNSLRATETRAADALEAGATMSEIIQVRLADITDGRIVLEFSDNGCGMPHEIQGKLYRERCSTQKGRDDGLGGVIIRKLLDLNAGSIEVIASNQHGRYIGTSQRMTIPRKVMQR